MRGVGDGAGGASVPCWRWRREFLLIYGDVHTVMSPPVDLGRIFHSYRRTWESIGNLLGDFRPGTGRFAVVVFGIFDSWDPAGKEGPSGPGGRASGPSCALASAPRAFLLRMSIAFEGETFCSGGVDTAAR